MKKLLVLQITLFLLVSCSSEPKSWEHAKNKNTINGYEKFLEQYPESTVADSAKHIISKLTFETLLTTNNVDSLVVFLDSPENILADEAVQAELENFINAKTNEFTEMLIEACGQKQDSLAQTMKGIIDKMGKLQELHPKNAVFCNNLAVLYAWNGEFDKAEQLFKQIQNYPETKEEILLFCFIHPDYGYVYPSFLIDKNAANSDFTDIFYPTSEVFILAEDECAVFNLQQRGQKATTESLVKSNYNKLF